MQWKTIATSSTALITSLLFSPLTASAHEAYVVPRAYFWQQIVRPIDFKAITAWQNPHDVAITINVVIGILLLFTANYFFRRSRAGQRLHAWAETFSFLGPIFVRLAIASAFFFGAQSNVFLGPELPITAMPLATILRWSLYAASAMIAVGFLTELAAVIGLVIFTIGFFSFGAYLNTYLNYLGELIVLLTFGMRRWSFDAALFGPLKTWRAHWEKYGTVIVRIFYGLALIYAAINVKFLHPDLTLAVVNDWHLTQFHWLFPSDPLLVVLGAGLSETAIGLFIVLGFQMRLTVLISLFYITLSLLYFRELVWPHILLYGISLNLLIQPETFSLDKLLFTPKKTKPLGKK
jgi:uncharacterized membrane protein YphA (DoxX/SURF4 family)